MPSLRVTIASNANRSICSVLLLPGTEWSSQVEAALRAASSTKLRVKHPCRFFDEDTGLTLGPGSALRNDMLILASAGEEYVGKATPLVSSGGSTPTDTCSVDTCSPAVVKVLASRAEVTPEAITQLRATAKLPGMLCAFGMPDLQPGNVGAAFATTGIIYPHLIGSDIGCGMRLSQLQGLSREKLLSRLHALAKGIQGLDSPVSSEEAASWLAARDIRNAPGALGTIGGGNHFAELQVVEEVRDKAAFESLGLDQSSAYLLVHSGSRGFGHAVLDEYMKRRSEAEAHDGSRSDITAGLHVPQQDSALPLAPSDLASGASPKAAAAGNSVPGLKGLGVSPKSELGEEYLSKHDHACAWARANRELIEFRFLQCLRLEPGVDSKQVLDVWHNNLERLQGDRWIHRKGAAPSGKGPVVIPGSRGTHSYLVQPKLSTCSMASNCLSLAHGGGRKWTRSHATKELKRLYKAGDGKVPEALLTNQFGGVVICEDEALVYEEAPQAYKSIDDVVADLSEFCEVIAVMAPIISYKTRQ